MLTEAKQNTNSTYADYPFDVKLSETEAYQPDVVFVFAAAGVREYWLADPQERRIEVHGNQEGAFALRDQAQQAGTAASKVPEGFSVALSDVFVW